MQPDEKLKFLLIIGAIPSVALFFFSLLITKTLLTCTRLIVSTLQHGFLSLSMSFDRYADGQEGLGEEAGKVLSQLRAEAERKPLD